MSVEATAPAEAPAPTPDQAMESAAALLRGSAEEAAPSADAPAQVEETKPDEKPVEKPVDNDQAKLAKGFAALSRQEKRFREEQTKAKEERAKLEAELSDLRAMKAAVVEHDIAKLEAAGFSFEEAARRVLNGGKVSPEAKLSAVEKKLEEIERAKMEAEKQAAEGAREQARVNYLASIDAVVQKDERFELVRARGATQDVWDVTEEHYKQTGQILPIEDAALLVEQFYEKEAEKLLSVQKIKAKLAPAQPAPKPPPSGHEANPGPRTLQNSLSAEAPVRDKIDDLDEDSRLARAARVLAGKAS